MCEYTKYYICMCIYIYIHIIYIYTSQLYHHCIPSFSQPSTSHLQGVQLKVADKAVALRPGACGVWLSRGPWPWLAMGGSIGLFKKGVQWDLCHDLLGFYMGFYSSWFNGIFMGHTSLWFLLFLWGHEVTMRLHQNRWSIYIYKSWKIPIYKWIFLGPPPSF